MPGGTNLPVLGGLGCCSQTPYPYDAYSHKKLRTTNAIENLNSGIVTYSRNVKRWQGGRMVVRWTAAAIVEAEKKFRRVQGWRDIDKLVRALDAKDRKQEATEQRVA